MSQEKKFKMVLCGLVALIVVLLILGTRLGENPALITSGRMTALKSAVIDWAAEKGSLPATLEELGLPPEELLDHYGTPFVYKANGTKVKITTLGGDKRPGGIMFKADKSVRFDTAK